MRRRQRVGDRRRAVLRAVVDRDDLECVGERRQRLERLVRRAPRGWLPRCGPGRSRTGAGRGPGVAPQDRHGRIVRARPWHRLTLGRCQRVRTCGTPTVVSSRGSAATTEWQELRGAEREWPATVGGLPAVQGYRTRSSRQRSTFGRRARIRRGQRRIVPAVPAVVGSILAAAGGTRCVPVAHVRGRSDRRRPGWRCRPLKPTVW